jgi:hypothetical protein
MARSNTPNGLQDAQQNKDLQQVRPCAFHDADGFFKKCCFAKIAAATPIYCSA